MGNRMDFCDSFLPAWKLACQSFVIEEDSSLNACYAYLVAHASTQLQRGLVDLYSGAVVWRIEMSPVNPGPRRFFGQQWYEEIGLVN